MLETAIVLAIILAAYIAFPFYQSRKQKLSFAVNHRAEDLEVRKDELYSTLKDIDFDFQMGKLSEADYKALREQYKSEAIDLLKELDNVEGASPKGKKTSVKINFCPQCGAPADPQDQYCADCGAAFTE